MRRLVPLVLALAVFLVNCGESPTEPVPDRDAVGTAGVEPGGRVALATASTEDGLTITTDKDDYQPGDTVRLTGSGWPAGDTLDILLEDEPATHEPHAWAVGVAADGTFRDSTYVVDNGDLDVTFTLTATSRATGRSLAVQFTDANITNNLGLNPSSASVQRGSFADFTVTVSFGGNDTPCTSTLTVSGLSTGTTGVFDPASVTGHTGDTPKTSTLRISTTASTPLGPDGFTVTAPATATGCDGQSRTVNGTINVFGAASKLIFHQQPTNATGGATISPAVTVQVLDANNNLVANSTAAITLAIGNNPGGGTLGGTLTRNAVNGVATFTDLSIDKIGSGYTLVASSSALTSATSSAFTISLGAASKLAFSAQPSGGAPNTAFASQPVVQVQDAGGNTVSSGTNSNASITLAIASGTGTAGATLTCTANPLTAASGQATFAGCRINQSGSDYRLRATASGLTSADSDPFSIAVVNQPPTVDAGSYSVAEGTALELAPSVDDPDNNTLTYKWTVNTTGIDSGGTCTFDDDTKQNAKVTCTDDSGNAAGGKFTLTLNVSDGIAPAVADNADLTVTNAVPSAAAGGPYSGNEGAAIQLGGSGDDPGNNDDPQLGYQWTVVTTGIDAGGACTFDNASSKNAKITCTDDGSFKVRLIVSDDDGGTSAVSEVALVVDNAGPVADAGGPYNGNEGSPVKLNGSVTDAGANDTHTWSWKYVDGAGIDGGTCSFDNASAEDPSVTCTDDGTVQLTLTVTDDDGTESEDTATLTLANVDPVANAGGSYTGNEGSPVNLNGSVTDAGANDTHTWSWQYVGTNVDPGASCAISNPALDDPTITCTDDGTVKLTLTVTDDDGGSNADEATLTVSNVNPVANAGGPYSADEGQAVGLNGMLSDAGANDSHTQQWTYAALSGVDAGATCAFSSAGTVLEPTVACTDDGTYQLTLTVTDDDGGTGTSSVNLVVANVAPAITALTKSDGTPLPATLIVAGTLNLRGTYTDAGTNDTHVAAVECESGAGHIPLGTASPFTGTCTYGTTGLKTISVQVTDDDGGSHTVTHQLTVKYNFDGFYAPVDRPNTMNVSKAGQAIPLKWRLTDANGAPITNLAAVVVRAKAQSCSLGTTTDQLEEYAAGESGLQNLGDGRYQFNWKTPTTYAGSCKSIELVFGAGGLSYVEGPHAYFSFKK